MGAMADGESDEFKRILLEGNPVLLAVTFAVSLLHSVFDVLAFKNDIGFWKNKKNVEGLSVRTILINCFCQVFPSPTPLCGFSCYTRDACLLRVMLFSLTFNYVFLACCAQAFPFCGAHSMSLCDACVILPTLCVRVSSTQQVILAG